MKALTNIQSIDSILSFVCSARYVLLRFATLLRVIAQERSRKLYILVACGLSVVFEYSIYGKMEMIKK